MTKKKIRVKVNGNDWMSDLRDMSVISAIEYLQELPENAVLAWDFGYELSTYGRFEIEREETDEEYGKRVARESADKGWQEQRERAEFERLQAKFGSAK